MALDKQATQGSEPTHTIPGLDVVGRGIYLRPRQPYQLKEVLVDRKNERPIYCNDTGLSYRVPKGYEVNDSPPMPANQTVNQTLIEETWESFEQHLTLDAKLAAGIGPFSVKANTVQTSQLHAGKATCYALRTSFIPLWTVYLPTLPDLSKKPEVGEIPEFKPENRANFERFFQRYGTHFVRRTWVGGTATLAFTIFASAELNRTAVQEEINASFGTQSGDVKNNGNESRINLLKNSQCSVWGKGGNESKLATLNSLDQRKYDEWLASIKDNPQAIELEVVGIWNLIDDEKKATALQRAYRTAYEFTPITAVFTVRDRAAARAAARVATKAKVKAVDAAKVKKAAPADAAAAKDAASAAAIAAAEAKDSEWVYFIRGNRFFRYSSKSGTGKVKPFTANDFPWNDAAFAGHLLPFKKVEDQGRSDDPSNCVFFFCRDEYVRKCFFTTVEDARMDKTYPKGPIPIAEGWPGVPFDRIDAVLNAGPESIYFFSGEEYARFNWMKNKADPGYPKKFRDHWSGVTFDRIDAAIYLANGKAYFFRGDQYIVYDMVTYRADPGYPKFLPGGYIEDWKIFG